MIAAGAAGLGQYIDGPSGLKVLQTVFDSDASAWIITAIVTLSSPSAIGAIFVPRVQTGPNMEYTAEFNSTFESSNFPCSTSDVTVLTRSATTCCLLDFVSLYHTVESFPFQLTNGQACSYLEPPSLSASNISLFGSFGSDMHASRIELLPVSEQDTRMKKVQIIIGSDDMRTKASRFSGTALLNEQIDFFVGFAEFRTVPGSHVLDSLAVQVRIPLSRSDYLFMSGAGTNDYTFLNYIKVRINEVLDIADQSKRSQYASVSFGLNDDFSADQNSGLTSSVKVGIGASVETVNWTYPCQRPLLPDFIERLNQPSCGPKIRMCSTSPPVTIANRFLPSSHLPPLF